MYVQDGEISCLRKEKIPELVFKVVDFLVVCNETHKSFLEIKMILFIGNGVFQHQKYLYFGHIILAL